MTNPSISEVLARYVVERAMLILAENECVCESEGEEHCLACEALIALEALGQAEAVAGMLAGGKETANAEGQESES